MPRSLGGTAPSTSLKTEHSFALGEKFQRIEWPRGVFSRGNLAGSSGARTPGADYSERGRKLRGLWGFSTRAHREHRGENPSSIRRSVVTPAGFEPAISTLKGSRPWPG